MRLKDKVSEVYNTSDEFVKAYEGLWSMLGTITYEITEYGVKIFDNGNHIRTWFECKGEENDGTYHTKRKK